MLSLSVCESLSKYDRHPPPSVRFPPPTAGLCRLSGLVAALVLGTVAVLGGLKYSPFSVGMGGRHLVSWGRCSGRCLGR